MDYRALLEISGAGMSLERKRLEVAAMNLANMHTSAAPGTTGYQPLRVVAQPSTADFGRLMGERDAAVPTVMDAVAVVPMNTAARTVHEPGHPHADAHGDVSYPAVDQASEMVTAMTAMRAYEANVAAAGLARSMAVHALEIGAQR